MKETANHKMTLVCVARVILKNIWIIVALSLSVSFISFIIGKINFKPVYSAETTFAVSRKGSSDIAYNNMMLTSNMLDTFESVMNSSVLHKRVCEAMGVDSMPGTVSVAIVPATNLITMTTTAGKPDQAFRMLKDILKIYPEVGNKVLGELILTPFENPEYPTRPVHTYRGMKVMGYTFAGCFLLVLAAMAAVTYTNDTVKSEQEVREKLDTGLLGAVYHEKQYKNIWKWFIRRRKSMRLNDPAVSFLYEETIKKISTKLLYKAKSSEAKVILVTSTVPGEGKSTVAMNLAQDISHRGKKTLLIDGNLRESGLAKVMQVPPSLPTVSWGKWLLSGDDLSEYILRIPRYGFDVMLNDPPEPDSAEVLTYPRLNVLFRFLREHYDVILIDAPPVQRRSDTEILAHCSDLSILVVRQNLAQTRFINDSIDMLEGYGSGLLGCIYNDAIRDHGVVSSGRGYGSGYYHYGYGYYRK